MSEESKKREGKTTSRQLIMQNIVHNLRIVNMRERYSLRVKSTLFSYWWINASKFVGEE